MKTMILVKAPLGADRVAFREALGDAFTARGPFGLDGVSEARLLLADQPMLDGSDAEPAWDAVLELHSDGPPAGSIEELPSGTTLRALAVEARTWKDETRPQAGRRTPGIGLVALWTARPGVPRGEVARHFAEHGPLALEIHHASQRYVQNWIAEPDGLEPPYAGIATHQLPSAQAALTGMFRDEADVETIRLDCEDFIGDVTVFYVSEHVWRPA